MRIVITAERDDECVFEVYEDDIKDALAKWVGAVEFAVVSPRTGLFLADTEDNLTPDGTAAERIADIIERDTGAKVAVEFIWIARGDDE